MLTVQRRIDDTSVVDFCAPRVGEWWRSHGDALQLAYKVAYMRWLVVTQALPHHGLTVLVIVPQGVETMTSGVRRGVDAQGGAAVGAQHNLLAPVAEDVTCSTGVVLRPVVHVAIGRHEDASATGLRYSSILFRAGAVKQFVK